MATPKRSSIQTEKLYEIDQTYTTIRYAIKYFSIAISIYFIGQALQPFAGQETFINIFISFLADVKFAVAITLSGAACAWAIVERSLRRRKTDKLQGRIIELESLIDPDRSSSGLMTNGTTNPKDKRP